jgi:hypothetical protein
MLLQKGTRNNDSSGLSYCVNGEEDGGREASFYFRAIKSVLLFVTSKCK